MELLVVIPLVRALAQGVLSFESGKGDGVRAGQFLGNGIALRFFT